MIRASARQSCIDLLWVLGAMLPTIWLLRPVSILFAGPAGLLLAIAIGTWRLKLRGSSWMDVGITRPQSLLRLVETTILAFVLAIVLGGAASATYGLLGFEPTLPDVDQFSGLHGNLPYFLFRLGLAWVTSFCEEFVFRGLFISWLERLLGGTALSLVLAVLIQSCLFGYLHAETQGTAGAFAAGGRGLAMGIGYLACRRNLWPVVFAHVALNTIAISELFLAE